MEDREGLTPEGAPEEREASAHGHLLFTPSAVVFSLSPEHRRQAAKCLHTNGEVRISFKDVAFTDLTGIRVLNGDGGVAVD